MLRKKVVTKKTTAAAKPAATRTRSGAAEKRAPASRSRSGGSTPTAKSGAVKTGAFGRPIDTNAPKRKAAPRRKPVKFVFKAQKEYKSGFVEVGFSTDKDGFIAPGTTVFAVKGKPDNPDNPRYDMILHDPDTAMALVARLSMLLYVSNVLKRLKANTEWLLLVRISVSRTKAGELRVGIKSAWRANEKTGKLKEVTDKKDVEYRRIRRAGKFLAAAFTKAIDLNTLKQMDKEHQAMLDRQEAEEDDE